jgi:4-amino-4-deoxy-L-arabinose transferase-like glycosyltransferase
MGPSWRRCAAFLLPGLAASALIWWATSHGAGVSPDSAIYLGVARSIRDGAGFMMDGRAVTHFPPGYPLLLAITSLVSRDPIGAARVLAALFFGINVVLVAVTAYLGAGRRPPAAIIAVLLFVVSGPLLNLHTMAWSEAPFFSCILAALLALTLWSEEPRRRYLLVAACALGAALVLRYAALPLLVPLIVTICWLGNRRRRDRLADGVLALSVTLAPLALWLLHNAITSQQATDRVLVEHLVDGEALRQMVGTLSDYFFPLGLSTLAQAFVLALILAMLTAGPAILYRVERRSGRGAPWRFPFLALVTSISYILFILMSISFADATTPLDERILFPVFGLWSVSLAILLTALADRLRRAAAWWAVAGVVALAVGTRAGSAAMALHDVHATGEGYVADDWQRSELMAQVQRLPASVIVYSNAQDAIEFVIHRPARWLPDPLNWESMQPNPAYEAQRAEMCRAMTRSAAVVAFFTTEGTGDAEQQQSAVEMCPGTAAAEHGDGAILAVRPR